MGLCSSTTNDPPPPPNRVRPPGPAGQGSSKYGPYRKNASSGQWCLRTTTEDTTCPPSFDTEKQLKEWLLRHITVAHQQSQSIVRRPGSVAGAQFIISDCDDCDIYVLDHTSTVSVDRCTNCRIYLGPCDSSTFIRDCNDCTFVLATRQLRTRNCKNNDMLLFCGTEPVIEKTKKLRLGCFTSAYFEIQKHFDLCALSIYHNRWTSVHDFTPGKGGGQKNWSLLKQGTTGIDLGMAPMEGMQFDGQIVPSTFPSDGTTTAPPPQTVVFAPTARGLLKGEEFLQGLARLEGPSRLIDCKHQAMLPEAWHSIPSNKELSRVLRAACIVRPGGGKDDSKDVSLLPRTLVVNYEAFEPGERPSWVSEIVCADGTSEHWGALHSNDQSWFEQWGLAV
jgi:hypothetical protein